MASYEELAAADLSNQLPQLPPDIPPDIPPGLPRIRVTPQEPPPDSLPPMQGRAPLEPDLTPAPTALQQWARSMPKLPFSISGSIGQGIGSLVQGSRDYLSQPAQPAQPREAPDPTAGPRAMWQRQYPSSQQPSMLQQGVQDVLNIPPRAVGAAQEVNNPSLTEEERAQAKQNLIRASTDAAMNLAGLSAPFARAGTAGVFGGRLSKTYNPDMEKLAVAMEKNGATPTEIWRQTGTMRGKDNLWIQEIPDIKSRFIGDRETLARRLFARTFPEHDWNKISPANRATLRKQLDMVMAGHPKFPIYLEDILDHPELYKAYPELRRMPVSTTAMEDYLGGYLARSEQFPKGKIEYSVQGPASEMRRGDSLDTVLHEVQHAIANIEGMAKGTSGSTNFLPGSLAEKMYLENMKMAPRDTSSAVYRDYEQNARAIAASESYRRSAGEGLARIPPQRKDFSPEQRSAIYPGSQMYPRLKDQLVEYNSPFTPGASSQLGGVLGAPELQAARDPNKRMKVPGGSLATGYQGPLLPPGTKIVPENWLPVAPTVASAQRVFSPEIYRNPRLIAEKANQMVAAEHPALKELFGVTRADLYDISQQGRRQGNMEPPLWLPKTPGEQNYVVAGLQTPQNERRIIDTLSEGLKHRGLREGMVPWYVMDPMFWQMEKLVGREQAIKDYTRLNATTAPFSASSDVMTEINRGTAANMYAKRGDYATFDRYGGADRLNPPPGFPADLADVLGHPYHSTSQSPPVARWLATGSHGYDKNTTKIPTYIAASGVPETGFQTRWPVVDAHIARGSGASDVRQTGQPGVSMKGAEYRGFAPWYREKIAKPLELEAVPTQALQWGTMAHATGVDTPIGAGKLELFSQRIWERAQKLGIDPKEFRDRVLRGDAHAMWLLGAPLGAGVMGDLVRPRQEAY